MLIIFFTIIFLAELVITLEVISYIRKADRCVCSLNTQIVKTIPFVKQKFLSIPIAINKINLSLNKIEQKIAAKKNNYKVLIAKNIVTWALLLALNMSGKKISSVVDLAFAIKDLVKAWFDVLFLLLKATLQTNHSLKKCKLYARITLL